VLRELIAKKQAGERIEAPKARPSAKAINLMDALKQSFAAGGGAKKPPAPSQEQRARKPARRPDEGNPKGRIDVPAVRDKGNDAPRFQVCKVTITRLLAGTSFWFDVRLAPARRATTFRCALRASAPG
jgi:hypothetical protein